jgi:hypothetical protein
MGDGRKTLKQSGDCGPRGRALFNHPISLTNATSGPVWPAAQTSGRPGDQERPHLRDGMRSPLSSQWKGEPGAI